MGMAASLVKLTGPFIQLFVPSSQWVSAWNLALIGQAVSEEMFEIVDEDHHDHDDGRRCIGILWASLWENRSSGLPTRSDTNRAAHVQKMVRSLKFWIQKVEGLYYPCSENKGADQLRGHRAADLCLCFRINKNPVFLWRGFYKLTLRAWWIRWAKKL